MNLRVGADIFDPRSIDEAFKTVVKSPRPSTAHQEGYNCNLKKEFQLQTYHNAVMAAMPESDKQALFSSSSHQRYSCARLAVPNDRRRRSKFVRKNNNINFQTITDVYDPRSLSRSKS